MNTQFNFAAEGHRYERRMHQLLLAFLVCGALTACGGGGATGSTANAAPAPSSSGSGATTPGGGTSGSNGSGSGTASGTLSGTVTGLTAPGLSLTDGTDTVQVAQGAMNFSFPTGIPDGAAYSVSVVSQPSGLTCTVTNPSGSIGSVNALSVAVNCAPHNYTATTLAQPFGAYAGKFVQWYDGALYGVNDQRIFRVTLDGALSTVYAFATLGHDAANASYGLTVGRDGNLYGVSNAGGTRFSGTVFTFTKSGVYSVIHNFAGGPADGANPAARLLAASDGLLYGTTARGGVHNIGTLFSLDTSGNFNLIYSFGTNTTDPVSPSSALSEGTDGSLYSVGTAANGFGLIFKATKSGVVSIIHSDIDASSLSGRRPNGVMSASDGNLYGTNAGGGSLNYGTIFRLDLNSGVYTDLYSFSTFSNTLHDAYLPIGAPIEGLDGALYGVSSNGGTFGCGALYSITLAGVYSLLASEPGSPNPCQFLDEPYQASDGAFYVPATNSAVVRMQ